MVALFGRMAARGMTEPIDIWGRVVQYAADGVTPVARPSQYLGTVTGYVAVGGGTEQYSQEGTRQYTADTAYFVPDANGWLTEENQGAREIVLPTRSGTRRRIRAYQVIGPYAFAILEEGGLLDPAGKVR